MTTRGMRENEVEGKDYVLIELCCSCDSTIGQAAPPDALVIRVTELDDAGSRNQHDDRQNKHVDHCPANCLGNQLPPGPNYVSG